MGANARIAPVVPPPVYLDDGTHVDSGPSSCNLNHGGWPLICPTLQPSQIPPLYIYPASVTTFTSMINPIWLHPP